jgi:hypothetical protein
MPKRWEEEFKKLFEMYPEMKFIWKYDGKDVDYPSNVLIKDWIPQTELLSKSHCFLFLFKYNRVWQDHAVFNTWRL